jgi:hypothetical protein
MEFNHGFLGMSMDYVHGFEWNFVGVGEFNGDFKGFHLENVATLPSHVAMDHNCGLGGSNGIQNQLPRHGEPAPQSLEKVVKKQSGDDRMKKGAKANQSGRYIV